MQHSAVRRHLPARKLSDTHGWFRRIFARAATVPPPRSQALRKTDDEAALEVAVLFSVLGLLLFLGMALVTDSEATRHALLGLG